MGNKFIWVYAIVHTWADLLEYQPYLVLPLMIMYLFILC